MNKRLVGTSEASAINDQPTRLAQVAAGCSERSSPKMKRRAPPNAATANPRFHKVPASMKELNPSAPTIKKKHATTRPTHCQVTVGVLSSGDVLMIQPYASIMSSR
jgi:hypothetical protein